MDRRAIESVYITMKFVRECGKYSDKEYIKHLENLIEEIVNE